MWSKNWLIGFGLFCPISGAFSKDAFVYVQGGMDSGGGHSVVCRNEQGDIVSAELYDYFEAAKLRNLKLVFPEGSLDTKVNYLLDKIPKTDRDREGRYKSEASVFLDGSSEVAFVRGARLPYFDDANGVLLPPPGCAIEQLAIQRYPEINGDPEFIINGDIWDHMPDNDRAGLILHEIIYRDAREEGAENSQRARFFNSLLATDRWVVQRDENEPSDELFGWNLYVSDLEEAQLPMPYTVYSNTHYGRLSLSDLEFYDEGRTKVARGGFYIPFRGGDELPYVSVSLRACNETNFSGGDIVSQVGYSSIVAFYENRCTRYFSIVRAGIDEGIRNFPKMIVRTPKLEESIAVTFSTIYLDPKGQVSCLALARAANLYVSPGQTRFFDKGAAVYFDNSGYVVKQESNCQVFESDI